GTLCPSWDGRNCNLINLYYPEMEGVCIIKEVSENSKNNYQPGISKSQIENKVFNFLNSDVFCPCTANYYANSNQGKIYLPLWKPIVQCDLALIPWFNKIGITSIKVIPANISHEYIKKIIKIWREAVDSYYRDPDTWEIKEKWIESMQILHNIPLRMDLYYLGRNF
ncbi:MAG: U32 family peptidase, partial [Candidatus Firestonebacteria bacterium]|nr:U32 family peptidase [Candidatus Firestonebacteria bacterium]